MNHEEINIVLFDGKCILCSKTIQFIIHKDHKAKFKFASLQKECGQLLLDQLELPLERFNSLVYIKDRMFYIKSTAVLMIFLDLGGVWRLFYILIIIPRFIRDIGYDFVAKRRYRWFGKSEICMVPAQGFQDRFL